MKHSGLAAELHVVHWSFLVDTEGKEGEEEESRVHSSISHWGSEPSPAPALPTDCQLCPAAQGCRDTSPGYQAPPVPCVAQMSICTWQRGKGQAWGPPQQSAGGRLLSIQLTNPSQAGTVAKSQTAPHTHAQVHPPLACPRPPPPNSKEQNKPHLSGLFTLNIGKTLTNVTNAK